MTPLLLARRLPTIACVQPEVSFYVVFNGVTIATFLYVAFCTAVFIFGQRTKAAVDDPERRRHFKTRCLNVTIWGLFLGALRSVRRDTLHELRAMPR
jgi:hypothetical protein